MPRYRRDELDHLQQTFAAGRELAEAGQLEEALPYFDQVLRLLPPRQRSRPYRIAAPGAAAGKRARVLPPVFRDALLAEASCLNALGRYTDAFAVLERALELDPENPQVYAELGFAHSSLVNFDQARLAFQVAVTLEPENPAHLCALAHTALVGEKFEEARSLALRAVELDPASPNPLHHLAYAEYRLGNLAAATRALERAVELAPADLDSALRLAGMLREAGHIREAIIRLDAYLRQGADDPEALGLMTELLQQDGTAPQLTPHVDRLLARNPRDPVALELLAWGLYQQGRTGEGVEALRRLLAVEPMQPHHHFKLGLLYQELGNVAQAMASLLRAAVLDSDGEVGRMATEAVQHLDQAQIEQLMTRAETDPTFRHHLQHEMELTLTQAGYLLSPPGLQLLQSVLDVPHGHADTGRSQLLH